MDAPEITATAEEIGQMLDGLTARRVRQLVEDGVIPKASRGRYPVRESVLGYVRFLKSDAKRPRVNEDDDRFRRARADVHEIGAAKQRGEVAPVDLFEEQIVAMFGLFVQETEGACARLVRSAGMNPLAEAIRSEFRGFRENLARGVERYCESLEERARGGSTGAGSGRRSVGARGADPAAGERGTGAV